MLLAVSQDVQRFVVECMQTHITHSHMHACVDACHPVGFCNAHSALQTSDAYKGSPSIIANLGGRDITAIGALADVEKEQSKRH